MGYSGLLKIRLLPTIAGLLASLTAGPNLLLSRPALSNTAPTTNAPAKGSATDLKLPSGTPPSPAAEPSPAPTTPTPVEAAPKRRTDRAEPSLGRKPAATPADAMGAATYSAQLAEADKLYLAGRKAEAEALYRQAKAPFLTPAAAVVKLPEAITDPALIPDGGYVYWREAQAGTASQLYSATRVPLELLVEQFPQFIPGHLRLAEFVEKQGEVKLAQNILEKAVSSYPNQPDLVRALVEFQGRQDKWLEASLTARQFALLNPDHPRAAELTQLSSTYMQRFQGQLRGRIRENAILGMFTGLLGVAITGSPFASLSSLQTMVLLARGETAVGNSAVRDVRRQLKLVEDPDVVAYVNGIGQKLAAVAGRSEFQYEFFVVQDSSLNAFAMPGGKIFINAGAITHTRSEAELAGLIGHEISHAVLSHGFQLATQGTAIANITQLVPYVGGVMTGASITRYSRKMEREADELGTRLLAKTGYAADGLRSLSMTLEALDQERQQPPAWLATHPPSRERVRNIEAVIQRHNYNRYAFEGVVRHDEIKTRLRKILAEARELQELRRRPKATPGNAPKPELPKPEAKP